MTDLIAETRSVAEWIDGHGYPLRAETIIRAADELSALRETLRDARGCLIDHLQYMKEPESSHIIKRIDAILAQQGGEVG